jgi:hypothetical protein
LKLRVAEFARILAVSQCGSYLFPPEIWRFRLLFVETRNFKGCGYHTGAFGKRHLTDKETDAGWDATATSCNPKAEPSDEYD